MKFVNFKTYEDRHGLEPGQLVCAADLELKACEGKEECYLVMINPKFDFGVDYRGGKCVGSMVAVVFPDSSYIDEKYHGVNNQELENIRFQAFSLHGTESHRDEKGGLGDMVTLGGMLTAGRDLEQVMDEVKSYYGAKDKDDLENKRSQYGKMKKEKVKN